MVKKTKVKRPKHIPQRTCVGCREVQPKRSLTRVVRTDTGIVIDPSSKMSGRGAYIHNLKTCWQAAIKGKLAHALKIELTDADRKILLDFMQKLPENVSEEERDEKTL
ncbi:MAG: YlxR family protein [Anaerolineaceae bacterium]|nr:YlxR family protein [Anaerolineaceae bacterium]